MNVAAAHSKFDELRRRAEEMLKGRGGKSAEFQAMDILSLIHELEVHEIELQTQNDELLSAGRELEQSRNRYADLYQHAPIGYVDLTTDGLIAQSNIAAKNMLGVTNEFRSTFVSLIHIEDQRKFRELMSHAAKSEHAQRTCELRIVKTEGFRFIQLEMAPSKDIEGKVEGWRIAFVDTTERKQAEEALLESKSKLEAALASMTDAVLISDAKGRFIDFNDAFATYYRFRNKGQCRRTLAEFPDILEVFMADGRSARLDQWAVPRALRGERAAKVEYNLRRRDTGETWIGSYSFGPIRNKDGEIVGSVVTCRDITERKRTEAALRESEERMRLFIEHAPAPLAMFDRDMRYLSVSRRWLSDYNLGERDLLGLSHYEIFPEIPERWRAVHRRALSGEVVRADCDRFERADGSVKWLRWEVRPWYDVAGKIAGIVIFSEDITERYEAERALQKSKERYRLLFENSMDANFLTASNGQIFAANAAACNIFGWSEEDFKRIGRNGIVDSSDHRLESALEERGRNGFFRGELTFVRRDGNKFPGEVSTVTFQEDGKNLANVIIRDITERKEMEDNLRNAYDSLNLKVRELQEKSENLQEVNTALKVLLKQREDDKKELGESVLANVRSLIDPYVEKLKKSQLGNSQRTLVEILESHLNEIVSPFCKILGLQSFNLTPAELKVAGFIRDGKSTDEISEILCISQHTVSTYRDNIREKLGLRGNRANLRSYLLSIA